MEVITSFPSPPCGFILNIPCAGEDDQTINHPSQNNGLRLPLVTQYNSFGQLTADYQSHSSAVNRDRIVGAESVTDVQQVNEITDVTKTVGASWVTPVYSRAGNMTTMPQPEIWDACSLLADSRISYRNFKT